MIHAIEQVVCATWIAMTAAFLFGMGTLLVGAISYLLCHRNLGMSQHVTAMDLSRNSHIKTVIWLGLPEKQDSMGPCTRLGKCLDMGLKTRQNPSNNCNFMGKNMWNRRILLLPRNFQTLRVGIGESERLLRDDDGQKKFAA